MSKTFIIPFLCISPFLFSCKSSSYHTDGKKYKFGLYLITGDKYYFNIITETSTKVSVMNKDMESNNHSEVGLIYEVVNSTSDSIQIKLTYDNLKFSLKNKDGEKEIDAANSGHTLNDQEKQLATVKGASMNITFNKKGDVLHITGGKENVDKLIATLNATSSTNQDQIREQFSKFIGDDFIRNYLGREFKLFPDTAVSVGDTWQMKSSLPAEINTDAVSKFTLDDFSDNLVLVESAAEINTDNKTSVMGNEVVMNMKGKQEGHFETDIVTGLLINGQSATSIEGNFQVMGKEVPVSIKVTKHISGKKM
ncbi:hypothetical protein A4H97_10810 [Niastella yeongjuensis]|uniref:Uncharacterized protein n=1 Tax=Niastella yeongjuensis TaxID=354355 RepID=A0A1V9EFK1_9BACT|nr:DUF6263 family protein [Niastella yeongjuensis]OQP44842.1 hypothetical protein A4H97_10810 [Niastella yeongjuensis]SEP42028.1 hypothetical protein SAMN05660816_05937 [Niastella yeongjuensis]